MASQTSDQTAGGTDRVSFELERLVFDDQQRLVVSGRWFGVRGRRFVRPTLTLTMRADGAEQRALADLEHKPWAADDGDPWLAAFPLDAELKDAAQLELSVAPDIAVELPQSRGTARKRDAVRPASQARAPRVRTDRVQARPLAVDQTYELKRLRTQLAAAERATESAHARREEAGQALEDERSEARKLRSELGRLRSELDIAQATGGELAAASSELDRVRTQAHESDRQLQATIRALDQQRAESERLRMRLTAAEATIDRLTRAHETSERAERSERETAVRRAERSERETAAGRERSGREATTRQTPPTEPSEVESRVPESIGSTAPVAHAPSSYPTFEQEPFVRHEPAARRGRPRTESHYAPIRPLNPALRSRPSWPLRVLSLIVILGVIAAIVLVIHSTIA
jgi:hypothetical protein